MFIDGIDFPNQIIDAINNKTLVVFAGAGASVDPPTSLPNFEKLAEVIAEGTGFTLKKNDSCEVFLGTLKSKGIPVNEQAAEMLSGTCIEHNKLHEAIVDLFPETEDIKIITTNYDLMFEHVLLSRGVQPKVFSIPAIPLGDDIQGIIHIHGNVADPKYMIVTDEDFGRAYLTEGYASRFLVKLFESYTVLFIGYSYKDTILRYLTRAMLRQTASNRYILTCDDKSDWSTLGITPIWFPKRKYQKMRDGLTKLGKIVKKGLLDWKSQLSDISYAPPKDLTADTEIDYCIGSIERSRILASSVHGKEWACFLDAKQVFDGCFSDHIMSEQDRMWGEWLCSNIISIEDDLIFQLIYKHNNHISKEFAEIIARNLVGNKSLEDSILSRYIILIDNQLDNTWLLSRLIEEVYKRDLVVLGFHLFKKLFNCRLIMQQSWAKESFDYQHTFNGSYYEIQIIWEVIKERVLEEFPYGVMSFVREKIEEIHNQYTFVHEAFKAHEPWEMSLMSIEDHKERGYREDALQILARMYSDSTSCLQEQNKSWLLRNELSQNLENESVLLRRLALKAMRITGVFSPNEVLEIILDKHFVDCGLAKEQVFLLVADIFEELDENDKNSLISAIESLSKESNDKSKNYAVYNWCSWLQRVDNNHSRIKDIVAKLHEEYGFEPRNHPELIVESSEAVWIPDKSPLREEELMQLTYSEAVQYLKSYKEDYFDGPSRDGLLKVLSSCVSQNFFWTKSIISELFIQEVKIKDIWQHIFNGIDNSNYSLGNAVDLLDLLVTHVDVLGYDRDVANMLLSILRREEIKKPFFEYEDKLYFISERIWNSRSHKKIELNRTIDLTINTTIGTILLSWIYMISFVEEVAIPEKYKTNFEQALKLRSWEKSVVACILAGHFNFLCYRDKDWCVEHLVPLLKGKGKGKRTFSSAWEGMVSFSGRINKDTVDIIAPIFLEATKNLGWLNEEVKTGFINLLLTLLIYVIDKPTMKYIPVFYRSATEDDMKLFIFAIKNRLRNMEDLEKQKWWNDWLKHFLDNRKKSKPVPINEKENQEILNLILELDPVFDDAVQTVCRGTMPKSVDGLFWFSLAGKKFAKKHPRSTAIAVTKVLNASSVAVFDETYIREIVKDIEDLDEREHRQLQEALLKKNILI